MKKLFIYIFLPLLFSKLNALDMTDTKEAKTSFYYLKLGALFPSTDTCVLPTLGFGARFQTNERGFDFSANVGSLLFFNYASIKGLYLIYPYPQKKNQFYMGLGPGVGYHLNVIPLGIPLGCKAENRGSVSIEGLLGYEFRHSNHFKTFIQLEITQPLISFGEHRRYHSYKPGIAITTGIGF